MASADELHGRPCPWGAPTALIDAGSDQHHGSPPALHLVASPPGFPSIGSPSATRGIQMQHAWPAYRLSLSRFNQSLPCACILNPLSHVACVLLHQNIFAQH